VIRPRRTASRTPPGRLAGMMSAEIQTFVSTTTRSARLSDRSDLGHDVSLDDVGIEAFGLCYLPSAREERVEASGPLVIVHHADAIRVEPGINGLTHELGDRPAAPLADPTKGVSLFLAEVDVDAAHRLYTIH
jgi:hypothetical protein